MGNALKTTDEKRPEYWMMGSFRGIYTSASSDDGIGGVFLPPPPYVDQLPPSTINKEDHPANSVITVPSDAPAAKARPSFEDDIIPEVSTSAKLLEYSNYVLVTKTSECILEIVERALMASKKEVAIRRSFSNFVCEFELHFNWFGEHIDARYKIYICGDNYLILTEKRSGDGQVICQLFNEVCDNLMDSVEVKDRDGVAYQKSDVRAARGPRLMDTFEPNYDRITTKTVNDTIQWTMQQVQSLYVDVATEGIIALVGVIRSTVKDFPNELLQNNVIQVLSAKLYSRDGDIKLSAVTAIRVLSEGGSVMHEAMVKEGTFFCLSDASLPTPLERCGVTPFSDAPFYHGRMERSAAEKQVGSMHPGSFLAYTDKRADGVNGVIIICLESLKGDGKSHHMEPIFTYDEVVFIPETKRYRFLTSATTFSSLSALVASDGAKWTTPVMTSITCLLIRREALKTLANMCQTKSVVDEMAKFSVLIRMRDAYEDVNADDVVRRAAWEGLSNVKKHSI